MKEQIKSWHYKAWEEDYFSKYVFQYLAFIWYVQKIKYQKDKDRDAIQCLKQDSVIKNKYLARLENHPWIKQSWEKVMDELRSSPLWILRWASTVAEENKRWNCPHSDINQKTPQENGKDTGVIDDFRDWENMIEFWYSIRNTLFHGGKNANDERDQLLVKHGYKTLRPLVALFIEELN